MKSAGNEISASQFWGIVGQRAVGATVVTAQNEDGPAGLLGLSASHVCADPPTMLVSVGAGTSALSTILDARHFAINYLAAGAEALADTFAGKSDQKGPDRFRDTPWSVLETGAPVFDGCLAAIDCRLEEVIERHETSILLGRVLATHKNAEAAPLIMFRGSYFSPI